MYGWTICIFSPGLCYLCIDNKSNTYVWLDHMYLLSGFMLFMHR